MAPTRPLVSRSFWQRTPLWELWSLWKLQWNNTEAWHTLHKKRQARTLLCFYNNKSRKILCETTVCLTHWGRVTHIYVSKLTIIGSDKGLSPGWRQSIIWIKAGILIIRTLKNKLQRNSCIFIQEIAFENVVCEMASICFGLNVLNFPKQLSTVASLGDNDSLGRDDGSIVWGWLRGLYYTKLSRIYLV